MSSPDLIAEHAEECCFLWHQRAVALFMPHIGLPALARLDERLDAHLDGLRVAGVDALAVLLPMVHREPGAAWAATILAAERHVLADLDELLAGHRAAQAAGAAVAWMDATTAEQAMVHWTTSSPQALVVAAWAAGHRGSAEPRLPGWASAADTRLAEAAFLSGIRLGIAPLVETARRRVGGSDTAVAQAAGLVLNLAGESPPTSMAARAPGWDLPGLIRARCSDVAQAASALRTASTWRERWFACFQAGATGDATLVPTLIELMADERSARCAGEAVALITGVDLHAAGLTRRAPTNAVNGPSEDPADHDVALHPDEDLPWPDAAAVAAWWSRQPALPPGRLLGGKPATEAAGLLTTGLQRQRWSAAIEGVRNGKPLFPVDGPAMIQQTRLAVGG